MGKVTGFLEIDRIESDYESVNKRIKHYKEFNKKYMQFEGQSIFNPVNADDIFNNDDFIDDSFGGTVT